MNKQPLRIGLFCETANVFNVFRILARGLFSVFFCGTVFLSSHHFNDAHVHPKYYVFTVGIVFFSLVALSYANDRDKRSFNSITILLTTFCIYLFGKEVAVSGITFTACFPLLGLAAYFLFRRYSCPLFFNTVIAIACMVESIRCIVEFAIHIREPSYNVTGSFDNSAGLAAFLSTGVPFSFFLFKQGRLYQWMGRAACMLSVLVVFLSGSRSGIISLLAMLLVYVGLHFRRYINRWTITILVCVLICASTGLFFLKKDSALGRLLIWRVGFEMVADHPTFGKGMGAFMGKYMPYQADYFARHSDSTYKQLADNTKYAFNEYLRVVVEHGVLGLMLLLLLLYALFRRVNKKNDIYAMALAGLAIFSLFSYPLRYPPVWILAIYCVSTWSLDVKPYREFDTKCGLIRIVPIVCLVSVIYFMIRDYRFETKWQGLYRDSQLSGPESVLDEYGILAQEGHHNPFFLCNYGVLLYDAGSREKSIEILSECRKYYDDYHIRMLLADNYLSEQKWTEAEEHYRTASYMCPNRFRPMLGLLKTFASAGKRAAAMRVAKEIVQKEEKVPSYAVSIIKYQAETFLSDPNGCNFLEIK